MLNINKLQENKKKNNNENESESEPSSDYNIEIITYPENCIKSELVLPNTKASVRK